jgi:hypothetical protein
MRIVVSAITENKFLIKYMPSFRALLRSLNEKLIRSEISELPIEKIDVILVDNTTAHKSRNMRRELEVFIEFSESVFSSRVSHEDAFPEVSLRMREALENLEDIDQRDHARIVDMVDDWRASILENLEGVHQGAKR